MTPKEKAKWLVDVFLPEIQSADRYGYNLNSTNLNIAKKCASIAVDEILQILDKEGYDDDDLKIIYWQEVKTEIEKL